MNNLKKCLFVVSVVVIMLGTLVKVAGAAEYYAEPQVYGSRPNPAGEYDLGPIGASGIMTRIYKGVAVTVEETIPNTPAHGKFKKGDIILMMRFF